MITTRKAKDTDRNDIAFCIAEGFEKDFSVLSNDCQKIANAIAPGLHIDKFFVAEIDNKIVGVSAISDCKSRCISVNRKSMVKHLGFFWGTIGTMILKGEFEKQLNYPTQTGYIEMVAVRKEYRKQKVATTMLKEYISMSNYKDFILDVVDTNSNAYNCYAKIGFKEFARIPEKHAKQKGFNAKIYMQYTPLV